MNDLGLMTRKELTMNAKTTIKTMMLTGAIAVVLMGTGDLFARDRGDDGRAGWNDGRGRVANVERFGRDMNDRGNFGRPEFRRDERPVYVPVRAEDRCGRFEPVRVITPCVVPAGDCTPLLIHRSGLGINININIGG